MPFLIPTLIIVLVVFILLSSFIGYEYYYDHEGCYTVTRERYMKLKKKLQSMTSTEEKDEKHNGEDIYSGYFIEY